MARNIARRGFLFRTRGVEKRNILHHDGCGDKNSVAVAPHSSDKLRAMKLRQNQVWKAGDEFLRIVTLERLEVRYKAMTNLATGEGTHATVTKKEFCRLIKEATLLTPEDEAALRAQ